MPFKYPSMAHRLIANSRVSDEYAFNGSACWEWMGARKTNRGGMFYGKLTVRREGRVRSVLAHRMAVVHMGCRVLRSRMVVMHLCNYSLCINPAHLAGGTQRKNVRQCVADGRHRNAYKK